MRFLLAVALVIVSCHAYDEKKFEQAKKVALTKEEIKRMEMMHYGWYVQAVGGLLGAMGKDIYRKMNRNNRKAFVACLDSIDEEHDLRRGAECLVHAIDGKLLEQFPHVKYSPQYDFVGKEMPQTRVTKKKVKRIQFKNEMARKARKHLIDVWNTTMTEDENEKRSDGTTGAILPEITKKSPKSKKYSEILQQKYKTDANISQPKKTRKPRKGKKQRSRKLRRLSFEQTTDFRRRFRRNILSLYSNDEAVKEAKRVDKIDRSPYQPKNMDTMPSLQTQSKSPIRMITDLLSTVVQDIKNETKIMPLGESYKRLEKLQEEVVNKNRDGQFKHRMLDMVIGKKHPLRRKKTFSDRFRDIAPEGMVDNEVYGLVNSVSKHTKDVNANFLSPRFFPVLPDKYAGNGAKPLLSPNLFPFYKDDSGNSILPIPDALEKTGMGKDDRQAVLELIMDASGVNNVVDEALNLIKGLKSTGLDKDVIKITEVIETVFKDLHKSFSKKQRLDMAKKKFTYMNSGQLNEVYGEKGFYNSSVAEMPFDVKSYSDYSIKEKEKSLWQTVRMIASGDLDPTKKRRQKRTIPGYTISFFKHTTLSPFWFAPTVNVLNVLGPIVLSPSLFSPNILSPLLIAPPIISPQVGNPLIFSPYVLGPNTISAAVFNAYVFSPYVLSPNVINPYVLSPLILSPYVLCPDVLSPTILSGVVLSPSVASPSVFTESALAANVLSPTFLS